MIPVHNELPELEVVCRVLDAWDAEYIAYRSINEDGEEVWLNEFDGAEIANVARWEEI